MYSGLFEIITFMSTHAMIDNDSRFDLTNSVISSKLSGSLCEKELVFESLLSFNQDIKCGFLSNKNERHMQVCSIRTRY